jgi:hypothetical protein
VDSLVAASPAEHAIVEELRLRRTLVDFNRTNGLLYELRYARLGLPDPSGRCLAPTDSVAMVSTATWPENAYSRLVVLADGAADIYMLEEVQRHCDGYTQTTFRLYFDDDRSTRVFVRHFSFLDGCPAIPGHEATTYYYGVDQALIAKEYVLADPVGRRFSRSVCRAFPDRDPYEIEPNWDAAVRTRLRGLRFIPG